MGTLLFCFKVISSFIKSKIKNSKYSLKKIPILSLLYILLIYYSYVLIKFMCFFRVFVFIKINYKFIVIYTFILIYKENSPLQLFLHHIFFINLF